MFERRIFVPTLVSDRKRAMKGLFEVARERRHKACLSLLFHDALERMLMLFA